MPTYEYKCEACLHRFEIEQRISEDPIKKCPECGAEKSRRVISGGAGISFKGSGFYVTDKDKKTEKPTECKACPKQEECKK